jgi:tetratricopeptide (TPR) repeat protein/energy-coupling factor transporter ATP-binding protein EcfA2
VRCPQCGLNIPSPGTTCPACNASLMEKCPECQFENLMSQEFCGSCGTDLRAARSQGLKPVSEARHDTESGNYYPVLSMEILNLDLLGEKLNNPTQVERICRDLMVRIEGQLAEQGVSVESVRENVMFFSFRQANNLRQGLQSAYKVGLALVKKVITLQGIDLKIRVGMEIAHQAERNPITAVSERLIAKPGELVVSGNIYQITGKQVPHEAIGPIKVQEQMRMFYKVNLGGKLAAQPAKTPNAESSSNTAPPANDKVDKTHGATALERKFEPPEISRSVDYIPPEYIVLQEMGKQTNCNYQQTFSALETILQEMVANPKTKGKIVGLCSPEGYGKTTIMNLLHAKIPPESAIWSIGNFYERDIPNRFPLHYWLEMIQILMSLPMEGVLKASAENYFPKILQEIFKADYTPEKLAFFKTFLSVDPLSPLTSDIRQYIGRIVPNMLDLLVTISETKPLVMTMENLEYADAASLELLLQLLQQGLLDHPILLVLTYSPQVAFSGPLQQAFSLIPFNEYVMSKLDEETLIMMSEPPLAVPWKKLPDSLRAQLLDKGSAMFLEESFRWLWVHGGFSIHPKTGKFSPEKPLKKLVVPEEIEQIIEERFEKLEDSGRYVLQVASVLGERFSTQMLSDLIQMPDQFDEILKLMWQHGFIMLETPAAAKFRHRTIWKTINQMLDATAKQKIHQLVADYLEQGQSQGLSVCPAYIAYHSQEANDAQKMVQAFSQMGVWLAKSGSTTGATIALTTSQKLIDTHGLSQEIVHKKRLYESLSLINLDTNPDYAKNLLLKALELPREKTTQTQVELQIFLAQAYERLGSYPHASSVIHRTLESLPEQEAVAEKIALAGLEIWYLYIQGKLQEAMLVYQESIQPYLLPTHDTALWENPALRLVYLKGELARSRIALLQCNPHAMDIIGNIVTRCTLLNDQETALRFRLTRCWGLLLKGQYEGCMREMELIFNEIEKLTNPAELMVWWGLILLMYYCEVGDWENATLLIPNAAYQAEQARDYLAWALCQALAGKVASCAGNPTEARKILEQAVTVSAEYYLSYPAAVGWQAIAENELLLGNWEVAEQVCERALEVVQKPQIQNLSMTYQLTISRAKILIQQQDYKQAGLLLEACWPNVVKSGYTPLIAEAAFQISELYRLMSRGLPDSHKAQYQKQQATFLHKAKTLWQEQNNHYRLAPLLTPQ